jgi:3-hydroxybutyryl-CoA dehydrogenase
MAMNQVAVIGGGTMGNGIAQVFATYGAHVKLVDVDQACLDRALAAIEKSLGRLVKKEKISQDDAQAIQSRITGVTDIAACDDRELVVEAVPERLELKQSIFHKLDEATPKDCILASNTSLDLDHGHRRGHAAFGQGDRHALHEPGADHEARRSHPRPGHLAMRVHRRASSRPPRSLNKVAIAAEDYPGFISNRVLMPMINEAIYCLMEGVSHARRHRRDHEARYERTRWDRCTLADFIGLDVCLDIMNVLHTGLGDDKYRACPLLRRMVAAGHLGRKTGKGFYEYN